MMTPRTAVVLFALSFIVPVGVAVPVAGAAAPAETPAANPPAATARQPVLAVAPGAFYAVSVSDLDAAARWYVDKLGLAIVVEVPKAGGAAVKVLEGGGLTVELVQRDGAAPYGCAGEDPTLCQGIFKAGLFVGDLDKSLAALKSRGVAVAFGPYPARGNQRANAIVRDHAGNLIQLFQK